MYKLVILFKKPTNVEAFEERWGNKFMPLAEAMKGIRKVTVSTITGGPDGDAGYYKIHELYFDSQQALFDALQSRAGKLAGYALNDIAGDIATVLFADVLEDDRPLPKHGAYDSARAAAEQHTSTPDDTENPAT